MFACTTGIGVDELVRKAEDELDDYCSLMIKIIADRLAEAFAELLHKKLRNEIWGYAKDEQLTKEEILSEKYIGIRPAMGYPSLPDHTENKKLMQLLDAETKMGISLTDSCMINPGASVSGLYFANPNSKYFAVGRITEEQVISYAKRKKISLTEATKWLSPYIV